MQNCLNPINVVASLLVLFTMNEKHTVHTEVRNTCALKLLIYCNLNHITGCQDTFDAY